MESHQGSRRGRTRRSESSRQSSLTRDAPATRAHSDRILKNGTRQRLYDHLLILPGDHFRSIARCLKIGVGTARHHLSIMVREGIVYERKTDGRSRFYVTGDKSQRERNELFGKHWEYRDLRLRIWTALQRSEGASATKIANAVGVSRQLATYHLSQLETLGFARHENGCYRVEGASREIADLTIETARSS